MDIPMEYDESPRSERTKLSMSQFGLMVDFLTLNPGLLGGKVLKKYDKVEVQKKWEELALLLNSDGTGARKPPDRWRKSWADMKIKIKQKVSKINSKSPYMVKLNDIECKAWKLISAAKRTNALDTLKFSESILKKNDVKYCKELEGEKYIVLNVDNGSEINADKIPSVNNVSEEDDLEKFQKTSNISGNSGSANVWETVNLDESNRHSDNLVTINDAWNLSMESESESISSEKVAPNYENANTNRKFGPVIQSSSHYYSRKRLKRFNYKPQKVKKQDTGVIRLLQRQNELLENISESIVRIEKAIVNNSSQQVKKNDLKTVHDNIGKIAECFGSVSASLKKIVEK